MNILSAINNSISLVNRLREELKNISSTLSPMFWRCDMNRRYTSSIAVIFFAVLLLSVAGSVLAQDHLVITTWNIENLVGEARGFAGGFGKGDLDPRTSGQLKKNAELNTTEIQLDIIAIQEISITDIEDGKSICEPLDDIISELGNEWDYCLLEVDYIPDSHDNLFCGFLWNGSRVNLLDMFPMDVPNYYLAGASLFDRMPLVGYFEAINENNGTNDFIVVNVHMKS
jgi:hypothetical protein